MVLLKQAKRYESQVLEYESESADDSISTAAFMRIGFP